MNACCILMLDMGEAELTAHSTAREAFEYAVERISEDYPRENIRTMDELREFEEDNGFMFEFRGLNLETLQMTEA